MGRKTNPKEGGMETPPDADAIARAFMEEELAKDRPRPATEAAVAPEQPAVTASKSRVSGDLSQTEVDAYIASLDAQVTDGNLLTPFTGANKRRAEELSQPFSLTGSGDQPASTAPVAPAVKRMPEPQPQVSADVSPAEAEAFKFVFPRLGQDKSVRYRASDGAVYEITKKPGGYRITKDGNPAIASISRTEIMKRGQTERWITAAAEQAETVAAPVAAAPPAQPLQPSVVPDAAVSKSPERRSELGISVGEVWSTQEGGHEVDIEILEFFDGPAKEGNARMARIRKTIAGPVTNENRRVEIPLYKLAERLKSYTKKREASKEEERVDPPLESPAPSPDRGATPAAASVAAAAEGNVSEAVPLPEAVVAPVLESEPAASEIEKQIAKLREEVASERAAFIAVEESQRSAWKNLTRIFRGLSHKDSDDAELLKYRAFYDEKVLALQNAELEKLKRSGKTVKELRPEMAALIREFEFDEAERIYAARQEMRLTKTNQPLFEKMKALWTDANEGINGPTAKGEVKAWIKLFAGATGAIGSSAVQGIEKGGAAYNKLMRSKAGKLILAASVGTAAVGIATGGVGTAAVGFLALKRLAAGAGVAVTIEGVSDNVARARREKHRANVEKDHEMRFDAMESEEDLEIKLGNKQEIDFSKLEKYLKEVSAKTRKGEGARRRNELLRKSGAIFAGAVLGSGAAAHFANEYIGGVSRAHAAPGSALEGDVPAGGPGSGPSTTESPAVAESLKDTRAIPVPAEAGVSESLKDTRAIPVPGELSAGSAKELLESHEVKRGESIWKLAEKSAGALGMDDRASGRFAKLVELKLQAKLEASPELARAAGFTADAEGKFSPHHIQAGAKLELGKLLSQDELAKLIEEAKGGDPISAPSVAVPDIPIRETVSPIPTAALSEAEIAAREEARIAERIPPISPDERAAIIATSPESPTTELIKPDGNVMKYIGGLPKEDQEKLFRSFKKISVELFQTNEVMGGEAYDMRYDPAVHPELTKTRLAAVIADHKLLSKNPLVGYDRLKNPLHWSQMEEVAKFAKASAKAFGESVAQPKTTESVQEYALRMVAIARNQSVKIPGFRVLD